MVKKTTKAKAKKTVAATKVTVKKAPAAVSKLATSAVPKKQTKVEIYTDLAEATGLEKKAVKSVMEALQNQIARHLKQRGSGEITLPELGIKVRKAIKPATKSRKGRNPFTGEEITISAKPKRTTAKVTALKALKELV
tara:strand:+ start:3631 stop:4044 length:414 start_codon:yes stop_codon:yes gene_type:complete